MLGLGYPIPNAASNHRGRPLGSSRQRPTASIALFAHTLAPFWRRSPTPDHARLDRPPPTLGPSSHAAHHQGRIASYDRIIHAVLMQVCIARSAMALDTWIFCSSDRLPLVGLRSGLLDYMGDGSVRAELPIARSCRGTCVSRVRCRSVNHIISSLPENDRLIACSSALTRAATQATTAAQDAWPCCSQ